MVVLVLVPILVSVVSAFAIMYDGEDAIDRAYRALEKRSS